MKESLSYRILAWVLITLLFFTVVAPMSCVDTGIATVEATTEPTSETTVTEPPVTSEVTEVTESTTVPTQPTETTEDTLPTEVTEPTETEFVSFYSYTEEELDLLARLVYSESCGESYETKLRVASVVMNRVCDPYFPNTIHGVIYQEYQFSVTTLKVDGVIMIDRPADEESYKAAKEILDYGSILPSTVQVFYATYCTESWVTSRAIYEISDNTVFAHIYGG